ncbi:MAG TPA: hypothetical protein VGU63_13455 [Candidatus Acidoferrales bacterium]|nr:hypothetical protein [Candidatus Acidoferrales bacterium]
MKRTPQTSRRNRKPARLKVARPHWRKLSASAWKTDLGGRRPEVVVLALSNEEYRKFHASTTAAKRFIDRAHFFKRKLIKVVFVNHASSDDDSSWLLIISHSLQSTAAVVAWQT